MLLENVNMYFIELFGNLVYDESISNISLSHFFKAFMSNFLTATGNFKTKSLARLEYNFLSKSEIVKGQILTLLLFLDIRQCKVIFFLADLVVLVFAKDF